MLRDIDGKETLTVVFDAVDVDEEVKVDVWLYLDTVNDEARLAGAIRAMNKDVTAAREQGSELKSLVLFFLPPLA